MPTTKKLKKHLQELIASSPALQSLTPEERSLRAEIMLSADEDTMKEFIDVLEEEKEQEQEIEKEFSQKEEELKNLLAEAKELEKSANREILKEKEKLSKAESEEKAEDLLDKLDDIIEEDEEE
jgi:hypothetical protein